MLLIGRLRSARLRGITGLASQRRVWCEPGFRGRIPLMTVRNFSRRQRRLARGTSIAAASDNDLQSSLYWRFGRIR
jgi:hypothetical protein